MAVVDWRCQAASTWTVDGPASIREYPCMPDRALIALVVAAAILFSGHVVDHVARGDVHWPLTVDSVAFILVSVVIYAIIGLGLTLYVNGKVGPLFWALVGGIGLAFGW